MKLLQLLEVSTKYFAAHGVESPRLTAELMLAEVLGRTRLQLYLEFESEVSDENLARLRPLVKQRGEGKPLEQVLGFAMFAGQRFKVTPDTLVPRPETELLLEAVLKELDPAGEPVVDVGTGSGILAIEIARRNPGLPVYALDISDAALTVARENGQHLSNLTFVNSNLLAALPIPHAQVIVANLPYIPSGVIPTLSREVRQDPLSALDGGPDGLDAIRELLSQSHGKTDRIALEIGDGQGDAVRSLISGNGFTVTSTVRDLRDRERIFLGASYG